MATCTECGQENRADAAFCNGCGSPMATAVVSDAQRKTVTVVFCDVTGSTTLGETLDPEVMRRLLTRYFDRMRAIVESHGGTVEKFIGDAVVAVFGVPVAHEDDALRAVRAAAEMRDALPGLEIQARIGVNSGEVVATSDEWLVTGDAVNVAARLEQAAEPGTVLLGETTVILAGEAVEAGPAEPLELKGKADPVMARRLVRVGPTPERRHDSDFVGRGREMDALRAAWSRVQDQGTCELITVVADAGVGKSRLVAEALGHVDRMVHGRCPPYGEGMTYWPVVEVIHQLGIVPADTDAASAIRMLVEGAVEGTSADDIAWAFRKTVEQTAAAAPIVIAFDDLQWGEGTFLDLIEQTALLSADTAVLLVCMARPELLAHRPSWPVTIRLEPLAPDDVDRMIPPSLDDSLRSRIARAAGGNPLFVTEMLAFAGTSSDIAVPPTLHALLAARLDQLDPGERRVVENGAIEGEVFHRSTLQALLPGEPAVAQQLTSLVRGGVIRPSADEAGGEAFRFRHLLIRDTAYNAIPKERRADLHERFAHHLTGEGEARAELDELAGYHLEQSSRARFELRDERAPVVAAAAQVRLASAGRRALVRADYSAAANLLERAAALQPAGELDIGLEIERLDALTWSGDTTRALVVARDVEAWGTDRQDPVASLCGRVLDRLVHLEAGEEARPDELSVLDQALRVFAEAGSDLGLYLVHRARAGIEFGQMKTDAALLSYDRAAVHAHAVSLPQEAFLPEWQASCRFYGSTAVADVLEWLDSGGSAHGQGPWWRVYRALCLAMLGRFEEARPVISGVLRELAERGGGVKLGVTSGVEAVQLELLAGNPGAALALGEEGCRILVELDDNYFLPTAEARRGQALYALDRLDEADAAAARSNEVGSADDVITQVMWRQVRGKVLGRRGRYEEAERMLREAIDMNEGTDDLDSRGEVRADLAEVLALAGRDTEARELRAEALDLYERKGNRVGAERMRTLGT